MQIGMVGLGRMGLNMSRRLLKGRHKVVGYNRTDDETAELIKAGGKGVYSLEELVEALKPPRVIWLMLPAGEPTESTIEKLKGLLKKGDTIIDGGNTLYKDDLRRAGELAASGMNYADVGVSGGVWGLKEGYCLMMGGDKKTYRRLLPALKTLAPKEGFLHCGPVGSGHFVKMVHNGIEYGMMSAYGEGFEIMEASQFGKELDMARIANLWMQGSVVRSWLLELLSKALKEDPGLSDISGYVDDSGEGRWTIDAAVESAVPAPVITASVFQRFASRGNGDFSNRVLAALRNQFGGHAVRKKGASAGRKKKGQGAGRKKSN
jgi:6-phosphogluconate dehydrogenase